MKEKKKANFIRKAKQRRTPTRLARCDLPEEAINRITTSIINLTDDRGYGKSI